MSTTKHTPEPWVVAENHMDDSGNNRFNHSIISIANGPKSVSEV